MAAPKSSPKDAQVMAAILKDMGITDHEPRVLNQMLEFTYRYVTDILDDAKVYSNHASKKSVDVEDVKLAIQCKLDNSFTTPPPRDLLMEVAKHKNNSALPLIRPYTGPKLPPDRYCLSATNYRLKALKKPRVHQQNTTLGTSMLSSLNPSLPRVNIQQPMGGSSLYGKPTVNYSLGSSSLTVVNKSGNQSTLTMRQQPGSAAPAARQLIRITPGTQSGSSLLTPASGSAISPLITQPPVKRKREEDDYDNP